MSRVLLKKSSVAGKVPVISLSDPANGLEYGELALNYADGKLYFRNTSNAIKSFTSDESVVTLTGTQTLTNKTLTAPTITGGTINNTTIGATTATTGAFTTVTASGIVSGSELTSSQSVGDEGGQINLAQAATNSTLNGGVTIDVWQNKLRIFEQGGTARGVYIDLTAAASGVATNLIGAGTGTVTSVAALTIGTTGTDVTSTVANSTTAAVITLNIPTASATNRGALSAADWTTFNSKQVAGTYATGTGTASGTNTGDETLATIKTKLGITTLSGSNTGDQTIPTTLPNANAVTFNSTGGAVVGSTYTGAAVLTVDYSTVGAAAAGHTHSYQAADADLLAIGGLTGTSGYLKKTAADTWTLDTSTFATGTGTASGTNTGDNPGVTAVTATAPVVSSGGTTPVISMAAATTSVNGYLTSTDWNTFNNKVSNATHTGDVTGSTTLTLATVNSNVGTWNNVTVNGKGLVTAASNVAYLTAEADTLANVTGRGASTSTAIAINTGATNPGASGAGYALVLNGAYGGGLLLRDGTADWGIFDSGGTLNIASGVSNGAQTTRLSLTTAGNLTTTGTVTANSIVLTGNLGTVTSVAGTGTVSGLTLTGTVTSSGNLTLGGTLAVLPSNFASQTATTVLAAPTLTAGVPTFRVLSLEDIPDAWVKKSVRAATTANITLSAPQTIDGIVLVAGDRVLVKDQTATATNGIYIVNAAAWTRALDADTISEIAGAHVNVDSGTVNGGLSFDADIKSTDVLGTTAMAWYRIIDSAYTIPITQGGTGAITAAAARTALGAGTVTSVAALTLGTTGTDITSTVATGTGAAVITLNVPTASATNRGALSAADWTTFNNKVGSLTDTLATVTGRGNSTTNAIIVGGVTIGVSGSTRGTIDSGGGVTGFYLAEANPRFTLGRDIGISGGAGLGFGGATGTTYALIGTNGISGDTFMIKLSAATGTLSTTPNLTLTAAALNLNIGALQQAGNQVLHAGNYNSYSPTLTGTGASGTWGISITGSAGSLSDTTNYIYNRGSIADTSIDTATANGFWLRTFTGASASTLVWNAGGSTGPVQFDVSYGTAGVIRLRNKTDSATWSAWRTFITDQNIASFGVSSIAATSPIVRSAATGSITLSHAASGATAGTYNNVTVNATGHVTAGSNTAYLTAEADTLATVTARGNTTTTSIQASNLNPAYSVSNFDTIKAPGLYQYDGSMTSTPNGDANYRTIEIGSNGRYSQIALNYSSDGMWFRRQTDANWSTWRQVWHSGNLTNLNQLTNGPGYGTGTVTSVATSGGYGGLTLTGGTITTTGTITMGGTPTGTWPISVSGSSTSTPLMSVDNSIAYGRSGLQYINVSGLAGDVATTTNTPNAEWWHIIRGNHANASGYYTDLALPMTAANNIRYRRIAAGVSSGWITVWDSTNLTNLNQLTNGPGYGTGTVTAVTATTPIISSGGTTPNITHATSGATAGTYNNVTVNTFGHVTAGSNVGYLTALSDTLATVTARGNVSTGNIMVPSGNGTGYCFWGDATNYKIMMSNASDAQYGPVTDYSLKLTMGAGAGRGITFGQAGTVPVAAINTTSGNMQIAGTFSALSKSFLIDHPTKPGMQLRYGSLEGPENGVYIRGRLNGNKIELPEYWTKLVDPDSITVNLTAIGKSQDIYVEDIIDNVVYVGGENVNCFYTVFAERVDIAKLEVEIE